MPPSYAHGAGAAPLLGETIGENLDRTIARCGEREALVSVHQGVRYTYAELGDAVDRLARGLLAAGLAARATGVGIWSTEQRRVGARPVRHGARPASMLVNINPAYRTRELAYVLAQSGCRAARRRARRSRPRTTSR